MIQREVYSLIILKCIHGEQQHIAHYESVWTCTGAMFAATVSTMKTLILLYISCKHEFISFYLVTNYSCQNRELQNTEGNILNICANGQWVAMCPSEYLWRAACSSTGIVCRQPYTPKRKNHWYIYNYLIVTGSKCNY